MLENKKPGAWSWMQSWVGRLPSRWWDRPCRGIGYWGEGGRRDKEVIVWRLDREGRAESPVQGVGW